MFRVPSFSSSGSNDASSGRNASSESSDTHWWEPPPHNCAHHPGWPSIRRADGSLRLQPRAYRQAQILNALRTLVEGVKTREQLELQRTFVADFFLADIETTTDAQVRVILWGWTKMLDEYFFGRTLTREHHRIVTVNVREIPPYGDRLPEYQLGRSRIFRHTPLRAQIRIARSVYGHRLTKHALLSTLAHEMAHVYVDSFYGQCPQDGGRFPIDGHDGTGHGNLWHQVNTLVHTGLGQFHDSFTRENLSRLPETRKPYHLVVERNYVDFIASLMIFHTAWELGAGFSERGLLLVEREDIYMDHFPDYITFVHDKALDYRLFILIVMAIGYIISMLAPFLIGAIGAFFIALSVYIFCRAARVGLPDQGFRLSTIQNCFWFTFDYIELFIEQVWGHCFGFGSEAGSDDDDDDDDDPDVDDDEAIRAMLDNYNW